MRVGGLEAALALAREAGIFCLVVVNEPRAVRFVPDAVLYGRRGALLFGRHASADAVATIACREIVTAATGASVDEGAVRLEVERRGFRYVLPDNGAAP